MGNGDNKWRKKNRDTPGAGKMLKFQIAPESRVAECFRGICCARELRPSRKAPSTPSSLPRESFRRLPPSRIYLRAHRHASPVRVCPASNFPPSNTSPLEVIASHSGPKRKFPFSLFTPNARPRKKLGQTCFLTCSFSICNPLSLPCI